MLRTGTDRQVERESEKVTDGQKISVRVAVIDCYTDVTTTGAAVDVLEAEAQVGVATTFVPELLALL